MNRQAKWGKGVDKTLRIVGIVFLWILSVSLLYPLFWMLNNSFKEGVTEYYLSPSWKLAERFNWSGYKFFFENISYEVPTADGIIEFTLPWMIFYSLIWAIVPPIFSTMITFMCAYVIAKYRFPGRSFLFSLGIIVMIFPIVGSTGSALMLRRALGIYDNMLLMILTGPSAAFSGMTFLVLHAAFKGIPWEYAEAVFIDGGGHLRAFLSIMAPMALPSAMVFVLLGVISHWNDYGTFMFWLPSYANLARGIYNFEYNRILVGATMPDILAGFVVVSVPMIILYSSVQKTITANFIVGGLKG